MKHKIFLFIFLSVILLGIFIRFYRLGEIPNSLDWDEVSQGYNAYSLLQTGKDEFGKTYPLTIRSFNDYKTPILTYLSILPVKFFGLTPFGVRFPSAFFGSISMLVVYGFVYEILRTKPYSKEIAVLSMLFFAISPWSIQFSRTSFDANVALFFTILAAWVFIKGVHLKKNVYLFASICLFSISVYTAHSEKVFSALFLVALFLWGRMYLLKIKIVAIGLIMLYVGLNTFWIFDKTATARSSGVLFTSSSGNFLSAALQEQSFDKQRGDALSAILHNRRFEYGAKYLENYLSHFDLNTLFITGDNARHHAPGIGVLYLFSLPFIIFGMIFVIQNKIYNAYLIFAWLLIAPIASAFAVDAPNYQRSLIFLPSWQIFEAFGWFSAFLFIKKTPLSYIYKTICILFISVNIFYYLYQYWYHTNSEYGKYWQYGYKESIEFTQMYKNPKKQIFFANNIEQAYIFYLFYTKYDPKKYLSSGGSQRLTNTCYVIDNAYFGNCLDKIKIGDFFITSQQVVLDNYKLIKEINYSQTKESAVTIYQYQ